MTVFFISDLHLDAARPEVTRAFRQFLAGEARDAEALYILGDLFEVWIGPDPQDSHQQEVIEALRGIRSQRRPLPIYARQSRLSD